MSNSFYNYSGAFIPGTLGRAEQVATEFSAVAAGFSALSSIGTDAGSANAYAVTVAGGGPSGSYTDGLPINFKPANSNTGASTINVNGIGAVSLLRSTGAAVQSGDLVAGNWYEVQYNTTYSGFTILAPTTITAFSGTISAGAPTYKVGLSAAGGSSTAACPIDATFAIDQTISPTWTGTHTFNGTITGTALAGLFNAPGTIGGVTPGAATFTTLTVNTSIAGSAFSTYLASPPAIGGTVAAAGHFTTLSASGTVSGTGFSTYLASPPAIGGTSPAAGAFTTLSASGTVSGSGFSTYLASPPAIGGTAAAAGTFTTLACTTITVNGASLYVGAPVTSFGSNNPTINLASANSTFVSSASGLSITIPANASVAFPTGTMLTFQNNGGGSMSILITTDTLQLANTSTTGTRTLAANGIATAIKITSTKWIISGAGLT